MAGLRAAPPENKNAGLFPNRRQGEIRMTDRYFLPEGFWAGFLLEALAWVFGETLLD